MRLVQVQLQHLLIILVEFMMLLLFNVLKFQKVTKARFRKLYSILKELRFYQLVLIMLLRYGMLNQVKYYIHFKVTKIKYSLVNLTTKEILLLLDLKIILVRYGEMLILMDRMVRRNNQQNLTIHQLQQKLLNQNLNLKKNRKMKIIDFIMLFNKYIIIIYTNIYYTI